MAASDQEDLWLKVGEGVSEWSVVVEDSLMVEPGSVLWIMLSGGRKGYVYENRERARVL